MPKAVDKSAIHLKIAFTSIAFMPTHRFCFIDEGQLRAWEVSLHSVGKLKQESEAPEQGPSEKESVQQAFAEHLLHALDSASRSPQSGREKKNSQQGRQTGVLGWKEPGGECSFSWISAIPCGNQDGSLNDGIRIGGGKDVYGRDSILQQGLAGAQTFLILLFPGPLRTLVLGPGIRLTQEPRELREPEGEHPGVLRSALARPPAWGWGQGQGQGGPGAAETALWEEPLLARLLGASEAQSGCDRPGRPLSVFLAW